MTQFCFITNYTMKYNTSLIQKINHFTEVTLKWQFRKSTDFADSIQKSLKTQNLLYFSVKSSKSIRRYENENKWALLRLSSLTSLKQISALCTDLLLALCLSLWGLRLKPSQGNLSSWARDLKGRDRDEMISSRDRDVWTEHRDKTRIGLETKTSRSRAHPWTFLCVLLFSAVALDYIIKNTVHWPTEWPIKM